MLSIAQNGMTERAEHRYTFNGPTARRLLTNLFNRYVLDGSIFHFRGVGSYFVAFTLILMESPFSKQCCPWSDATICGIWSGSALFAFGPFTGFQVRSFFFHHPRVLFTNIFTNICLNQLSEYMSESVIWRSFTSFTYLFSLQTLWPWQSIFRRINLPVLNST